MIKSLLTLSILSFASLAFGQDISKLLEVSSLQTKNGLVSWYNFDSFAAFKRDIGQSIKAKAKACGIVTGVELKADLATDYGTYIVDKEALQTILNSALADEGSYQACEVKVPLVRGPSGPGVDSGTIVYTVIDPTTAQEVVLGLYAEYF